ncbi:MAG: PAC2 family protein [Chitinispirillaceae bacterium]
MKILEHVSFSNRPTVLAAWPGMGNVGLITVDYLRRGMNAVPFAEIDMSPYFIPESIVVKQGIAQFPEIPSSVLYHCKDPDLVIFESNAQFGGRDGIQIIKMLLDLVGDINAKELYTFAAFSLPMSYQDRSEVLMTCNNPDMFTRVSRLGVAPMPDGHIAGMNGLLLGVAASRGMDAACLLGTIPNYAANLHYPKASLEIIQKTSDLLDLKPDTTQLEENILQMEQQFLNIEERIREFFPSINKDEDFEIGQLHEDKVPHFVMDRIEKLFQEASHDIEKASRLKEELDRWNLFELYEDRFLDLFEDRK